MKLSRIAESIPGSGILAISNAIKERKNRGEAIHNFTVGDFDPAIFPIPHKLEQDIIEAYRMGYTNYPQAEGNLDLRESITYFTAHFQELSYEPGQVLVASGGRPLIYALYQVVVDPGDKVIYPVPSWNNHAYTQFTQGIHCTISTKEENDFLPTAAEIEPHLKDAVLLSLCSPQNPSGTCFSEERLRSICEMVVRENESRKPGTKKLYLLFDQMYQLLVFGPEKAVNPISVCPDVQPYTISVDAISKGLAATGLRVGWCLGPPEVLGKMKSMLTHVGAWAPMAEQKAVAKFLRNTQWISGWLADFKTALARRLGLLYRGFMDLKAQGFPVDAIRPKASIYLSVKIDLEGDVLSFLLNEAGLAILPFSVFGVPQPSPWFRVSVGTCQVEDIAPMLKRLKHALTTENKFVQL